MQTIDKQMNEIYKQIRVHMFEKLIQIKLAENNHY